MVSRQKTDIQAQLPQNTQEARRSELPILVVGLSQAMRATYARRDGEERKHLHQAWTALVFVELPPSLRMVRHFHPVARQVSGFGILEHRSYGSGRYRQEPRRLL